MGVAGKGKKPARGKDVRLGKVMGIDYEFDKSFDFTFFYKSEEYKLIPVDAFDESKNMKQEPHPWLQFRDTENYDKIAYLNKLAEIKDYPVQKPRRIDWDFLTKLEIKDDVLRMLRAVEFNDKHVLENVDMWGRIFRLNRAAYREWCLELFSTLRVDNLTKDVDIVCKQLIHFRIGGKKRHCTILGFSYLTGMMEREELMTKKGRQFLLNGHYNTSEFHDDMTFPQYWRKISRKGEFASGIAKAVDSKSKKLRIIHKMITYSFHHRGNRNDKVYSEDIWLLRYFSELSPSSFALAPYLLARHMSRHQEKKLLCRHFLSMIVERLGLTDRVENKKHLSGPENMLVIQELDFVKYGMLTADKSRLLRDDEAPPPPKRLFWHEQMRSVVESRLNEEDK